MLFEGKLIPQKFRQIDPKTRCQYCQPSSLHALSSPDEQVHMWISMSFMKKIPEQLIISGLE
jgi:hypothetical protein